MFVSSLSVEDGSQRAPVGSFVFLHVVYSFVLVGDRLIENERLLVSACSRRW